MYKINVYCINDQKQYAVPKGTTLEELYALTGLSLPHGVLAATVNNKVEGLHYSIYDSRDVEFLNITKPAGERCYTRSLFFVLYKAVCDLYPSCSLRIDTALSGGYYCHLTPMPEGLNGEQVALALRERMLQIVGEDLPFHRQTIRTTEAIRLFREQGLEDKALLLEGTDTLYTHCYTLGDVADYFYGSLILRTSGLYLFDLEPYADGMLLRTPDRRNPSVLTPMRRESKMFDVFDRLKRWQDIVGISTIGALNKSNAAGYGNILISVSEALQEKRFAQIADRIAANPQIKVVLIAGPSSSGKTTTSKRMCVQLIASGKKPYAISLDDYFVNREDTPLDADGNYDFESIHAMDIDFFNAQMNDLLSGKEVELPRFNFQTGHRENSGKRLRLTDDMILILEGIHGLNPMLSATIPNENKFKIYASALTTIKLDHHNYIPTTDNRLLRRIVRDHKYRGYSALDTIRRWPSVQAGEEKWIYPYQEEADEMVNTALLFELAALRDAALPLLAQVPESAPEYCEAYRLCKFLSYLHPIAIDALPPTSLLREFMGGSTFDY